MNIAALVVVLVGSTLAYLTMIPAINRTLSEPFPGTRMRFRLRRRMILGVGFFETSVALALTLLGGTGAVSTSLALWLFGLGAFGAWWFMGRHRWFFLRNP